MTQAKYLSIRRASQTRLSYVLSQDSALTTWAAAWFVPHGYLARRLSTQVQQFKDVRRAYCRLCNCSAQSYKVAEARCGLH